MDSVWLLHIILLPAFSALLWKWTYLPVKTSQIINRSKQLPIHLHLISRSSFPTGNVFLPNTDNTQGHSGHNLKISIIVIYASPFILWGQADWDCAIYRSLYRSIHMKWIIIEWKSDSLKFIDFSRSRGLFSGQYYWRPLSYYVYYNQFY